MKAQNRRRHLDAIFRAGLKRVDPYAMVHDHVRKDGTVLQVRLDEDLLEYNLDDFKTLYILGCGKATAPMARAMEEILQDRITAGLIVVKYGHTEPLKTVQLIEAGHPVPDEQGVDGARRLLHLAKQADESSLVINLISGGGSALLPLPAISSFGSTAQLTLADKQETTQQLLTCGAGISEMNCVRKHLSDIKGGRLVAAIAPARSINLILSDVVGDDLSSIASGLTAADPTTFKDALAIVRKYGLIESVPEVVLEHLQAGVRGDVEESAKIGAAYLSLTTNILLGTNRTAMLAAESQAKKHGFAVRCLTSSIEGEAREVAGFLAAIAVDTNKHHYLGELPVCIISGGEPVVTLTGQGKGGRNQEMSLAFLAEMQRRQKDFDGISFLAASTDGNDGPTDAAGAFADLEILQSCQEKGLGIDKYLGDNDSYTFFEAVDALYKTGPTNTNVCDLHIILIE